MRHHAKASFVIPFLLALSLRAADVDVEIQLRETKYAVNANGSVEIAQHERWRALTGNGRKQLSPIDVPYVQSLETVEFRSIKTLKSGGTVVEGDRSRTFDL
jgi:predicted NAD/FAD-binding protein